MEEDWPKACEDLFGSLRKGDHRANTWYEIEGSKQSDYRRLAGLLNWIQKYPKGDGIAEKLAQK